MDHLITTVPDKLFVWDSDGTYISYCYLHPNVKHFVGPDRFLNKRVREVLPVNMADRLVSAIRAVIETQRCQICHLELPLNGLPYRQVVRLFPNGDRVLGLVHDYPLQPSSPASESGCPV